MGTPFASRAVGEMPEAHSVEDLAKSYGRAVFRFGAVLALAPATRSDLQMPTGKPSLAYGMSSADALFLLVALLSDSQLAVLKSDAGLSGSDVQDPLLHDLFVAAIAPRGKLVVNSTAQDASEFRDFSDEIPRARLRLGKAFRMYVPVKRNGMETLFSPISPGKYYRATSATDLKDCEGLQARRQVPNELRQDRTWPTGSTLSRAVSLAGAKTVGDAVSAIGTATGFEIYADARVAPLRIAVSPADASVAASDLLKAIAVCVTGTYRRVGPAYVLTDHAVGVGAKREAWRRFGREAADLLEAAIQRAAPKLKERIIGSTLPTHGDGLQPSDDQHPVAGMARTPGELEHYTLPFEGLNDTQRAMAERIRDAVTRADPHFSLDGDMPVHLVSLPEAEVLLPGLDAPVTLGTGPSLGLQPAAPAQTVPAPPANLDAWKKAFEAYKDRAAFVDMETAADRPAIFGLLKRLGATEVWLRLPMDAAVAFADNETGKARRVSREGLRDALRNAAAAGLRCRVLLDLLTMHDAPKDAADETILGDHASDPVWVEGKEEAEIWLDSSCDRVQAEIGRVARWLAKLDGISGVVLRKTDPPGSMIGPNGALAGGRVEVGYTLAARLDFLRKFSVDPIDLSPCRPTDLNVDTAVPLFDEPGRIDELPMVKLWNKARMVGPDQATQRFADEFLRASRDRALSLHVRQRRTSFLGWYGDYPDVSGPLPGDYLPSEDTAPDGSPQDSLAWARTFSQSIYKVVVPRTAPDLDMLTRDVEQAHASCPSQGLVLPLIYVANLEEFLTELLQIGGGRVAASDNADRPSPTSARR